MNSMKLVIPLHLILWKEIPNDAVTPQRQSQFTPKMKANAVPRLLSSLVWIDLYNERNRMTSFMEFMIWDATGRLCGVLKLSQWLGEPPCSVAVLCVQRLSVDDIETRRLLRKSWLLVGGSQSHVFMKSTKLVIPSHFISWKNSFSDIREGHFTKYD